MARKLRLKTHKKWSDKRGGLVITYYGHRQKIYDPWGFDNVSGVFQGVWHGPGPARKATRKFYILDYDHRGTRHHPTYLLFCVTLPKAKRKLPAETTLIAEASEPQLDRMFGKKWEDWTPQHLATKLLEASK